MVQYRCYSGIGSRDTPDDVRLTMSAIAKTLAEEGFWLRSGGAGGADDAFETGALMDGVLGAYPKITILLPWRGFNGRPHVSPPYFWDTHYEEAGTYDKAMEIASKVHPAWGQCDHAARALHARNVYQILGIDLNTPSDFVICWTMKGRQAGGTRTALVLAEKFSIPVFNLGDEYAGKSAEEVLIAAVDTLVAGA